MTQSEAGSQPIPFPRGRPSARPRAKKSDPVHASLPFAHHNLPPILTPFMGRYEQVQEVSSLLIDESVRLLTLSGPGGVGKTRLALRVAEEVLPNFEDGAWFVALAPVSEPELVVPTIARTLGVKEEAGLPIGDTLKRYLGDRGMLLILDNFEQVAGAAVEVAAVLAGAPGVQVLVTTRVSLHLYGEYEYPVPPMALPGAESDRSLTAEALGHYEAIQFFVARSRATRPQFRLSSSNAEAVASICRRLDGLPLALELAAARTRLFTPQALLSRLDRSLPLLVGGPANAPARHGTLRNAIAWSYDLLSDEEQRLFTRLGVFAGGCTLDAAAHIASEMGSDESKLLNLLDSLIDKNLLRQREQADGEPRFWMLETIREYALEELAKTGELEEAQERHADFFLALAEKARPYLRGSQQEKWFETLEKDQDNFRASLTFLLGRADRTSTVRLASALGWFWYVRGYFTEGRRWLDLALSTPLETDPSSEGPTKDALGWWADALRVAGALAFMQSEHDRAIDFTRQSLEVARRLGDDSVIARSLNNLSIIISQQGELKQARLLLEESLDLKRRMGTPADIAVALSNLAGNSERMGDYERANRLNEEAIAITHQTGDKIYLSNRIHTRGLIALREGRLEQAIVALNESLVLAREVGFKTGELAALYELGAALCDAENGEKAQATLEEAFQLAREQGDFTAESSIKLGLGRVAMLRGEHEQARDLMQEALRINIRLGEYNPSTVETLEWLAGVEAELARKGDSQHATRAAVLLAASAVRRQTMGAPVPPIWRDRHEQTARLVRSMLSPRAFATAWASGNAMPFADAVALSIEDLGTPESTRPTQNRPLSGGGAAGREDSSDLTSREKDVLRLIASGLTNKEIGEQLVLSHRTVEAHLYSVFNKLNVTTRSAAARYAIDHGLARESAGQT